MKKFGQIQIHDAKLKGSYGYRVKSVAANGEILQTSEVLESAAAVKKNIRSMSIVYRVNEYAWSVSVVGVIFDCTKNQKFTGKKIQYSTVKSGSL